jgi:hypothetical protein
MAETAKGNKVVVVHSYKRTVGDKVVTVPQHDRSTPKNATGKRPK